jgi:hypothetical protein
MFGRIPYILSDADKLKKLMDLLRNHKFSGGLLGITLTVTTAKHGDYNC